MVFESPTGIERNKKVQLAQAIVLIFLAAYFFISRIINTPPANVADGVYKNKCCADIIIKNRTIEYKGKSLPIDIENMKFGLTGYVDANFSKAGMQKSDDSATISLFREDGTRALSLLIEGRDTTFKSVEGNASE